MICVSLFLFFFFIESRESWTRDSKFYIGTYKWSGLVSSSTFNVGCSTRSDGSTFSSTSSGKNRSLESRSADQYFLGCQVDIHRKSRRHFSLLIISLFSSQVLFSISQKLIQHQIMNYTDILKWLREILICRNAFLMKHKEYANLGSQIAICKQAHIKLEVSRVFKMLLYPKYPFTQ